MNFVVVSANHILVIKHKKTQNDKETLIFVGEVRLEKSKRYSLADNIMQISKIRKDDAGLYICHYQSDPVSELVHVLDVQYPPKMVSASEDKQVTKGDSVTLECSATGNPTPTITWSKVGGHMPSGQESEEGFSLTLDEVNRHVEGTYQCTADNQVGEPVSAQMAITVVYPPEIITEKVC